MNDLYVYDVNRLGPEFETSNQAVPENIDYLR